MDDNEQALKAIDVRPSAHTAIVQKVSAITYVNRKP